MYTRTTSRIIKNKTLDKTFTIGQVAELRTNQGSSVVVQILNSGGGQEGLLNIKYSATSPTCVLIINMPWSSSDDGYAVRKKDARRIIYEALSASQRALEKTEKYLLSDINTRPFGFHPPKSFTENGAIELEMPSIDIQFKFKPMDLANVSRSGDRFKICENPALELLYTGVTSDFDVKTDPNELDSIKIDPFDFDVFERTLTLRNRKLIVLNTKAGRAANFFLQLNNSAGVQVDRPGDIEYYDSGLVWKLGVKKFTEELEKNCSNFVWEKIAVK
ncbi:MAG: hypothetical protein NTV34_01905 [Proteobacteria bacterium]|nr:hypothetical protein [Pseudomonadota bacterium]